MDEETQKQLNQPLQINGGMDEDTKSFLELLLKHINDGNIDLHKPSSLINEIYYNGVDELKKGKTDMEAFNMLSIIREIKDLYDAGYKDSYQIKNMVEHLKESKERLENEGGDLFII